MSEATLIDLARARGLSSMAELLAQPEAAKFIAKIAPPDEGLTAEPQPDQTLQLGLMTRRGLDPALVGPWIETLESSLERGLAAWDVLTGSLIADADWLATMRAFVEPVRDLLPPPGQRGAALGSRAPSDVLRTQLGDSLPPPPLSPDSAPPLGLAGIWALYAAGGDRAKHLADPEARASLRAQGKLLGLAHFPSLASLWLHFVHVSIGDVEAYVELAEILLDAHAVDRLPRGLAEKLADARLAKYIMARASIDAGDPGAAYALLKTIDVLTLAPALQKNEDARIQLIRADLGLRTGEQPVSPARIEEIVQTAPTWRYAARVRAGMAAQLGAKDSSSPIRMLDEYLAQFGNDDAPWLSLVEFGPAGATWFAHMMARLTREAQSLPHEPSVWIALASIVADDGGAAAVAEIRARLVEQSRLS
ncbi:MAG: hypothetical protein JWN44_6898 [Myxococcales bacterium]|nr:hypothetical protein [Myxococcales bacterium]